MADVTTAPTPAAASVPTPVPAPPDWFHAALQRWERPVLRYALTLSGDLESARDAAQDTFLRLFRAHPDGATEDLGKWLFTVCRNLITDLHRKNQRIVPMTSATAATLDALPDESPAAAPAAALEKKEETSALRRMVSALPARERELVRLKFEAGLSYREIAAATGLTVSNVGYLLHQAVQGLRAAWAAGGGMTKV